MGILIREVKIMHTTSIEFMLDKVVETAEFMALINEDTDLDLLIKKLQKRKTSRPRKSPSILFILQQTRICR